MKYISRPRNVCIDEENPYWISFSDLMSALLVIFILTVVALIIELTETQKIIEQDIEQLRNAERARKDILHEIRDELAKQNIIVNIADNDTVLRIPHETLTFTSRSFEIPDNKEMRKKILTIGKILHAKINKPFDGSENSLKRFEYLDTVFIEGHTDSQTYRHPRGNWGLSTDRAISLWKFWERLNVSPPLAKMKNAYGLKLFSVSGYAASRRLQLDEKTPEQRTANRRIDIRLTVKRPLISQFKKIVDQ